MSKMIFFTNVPYNINGISVLDAFELNTYINILGQPDSIIRGGQEIIDEFGHDDYDLWYGESLIIAQHGYILTANIQKAGISLNGIQVGNNQTKIENTFKIIHLKGDTIILRNKNDDVVTFYLKNKIIQKIVFWRPL